MFSKVATAQVDENYDDQMSSSLHRTRALLDTANETIVTQVSTFDELLSAMEDGYQDIEIMEHMDATSRGLITAAIQGIDFKHQLPPQKSQTRSIRVCSAPLRVHETACSCALVAGLQSCKRGLTIQTHMVLTFPATAVPHTLTSGDLHVDPVTQRGGANSL